MKKLLLVSFLLFSSFAYGDSRVYYPLSGEAPTQGIRLANPTLASGQSASLLEINPALVGWIPSWSIDLISTTIPEEGRFDGNGVGLYTGFALSRRLRLALGFSWLKPSDVSGYEDSFKWTIALGYQLSKHLSLGFNLNKFYAEEDDPIDNLSSIDFGLSIRFFEWMAFGAVVRNLNMPEYDGFELSRVYDSELAFRPFSNRRFELAFGAAIHERRIDIDPHLRLSIEPIEGLTLFGYGEIVRRDFYRNENQMNDYRFSVGLSLAFENSSISLGTLFGRSLDPGTESLESKETRAVYQGTSFALHLRGDQQQPFFDSSRKYVKISIQKLNTNTILALNRLFSAVKVRDDVVGVILNFKSNVGGWANAQELHSMLKELQDHKKEIISYINTPSAKTYYAASLSDRIILNPAGGIWLSGIATGRLYLANLFKKLGIKPQFIKIAEYKSAPETFTEEKPTKPAKEMQLALLDSIYQQLIEGLAKSRNQSYKAIKALIEEGPFTPDIARQKGLVDELVYPNDISSWLSKRINGHIIGASRLLRNEGYYRLYPTIAVVTIEGDIVSGKSKTVPLLGQKVVGDQSIVKALKRIQADRKIKAVVLRVNSPGGSALASEHMWRELVKLNKQKPVIVSMGNVAASGGYFVAAGARKIFALPATITGSIGIFTGKLSFKDLLEKIGIHIDEELRGKHAALNSVYRPYTDEEKAFILKRLHYYYNNFTRAVAKGRKLDKKAIDRVARGRVFTGKDALSKGLVDQHGGLSHALKEAKALIGIKSTDHVYLDLYPKKKRSFAQFLMSLVFEKGTKEQSLLPKVFQNALKMFPASLFEMKNSEPMMRLLIKVP